MKEMEIFNRRPSNKQHNAFKQLGKNKKREKIKFFYILANLFSKKALFLSLSANTSIAVSKTLTSLS